MAILGAVAITVRGRPIAVIPGEREDLSRPQSGDKERTDNDKDDNASH